MSSLEKPDIQVKTIIKRTLADGTEKTYIYDQKIYNDTYYLKNKERLNQSIECDVCKGTYCLGSKSRHKKSLRHQTFLNITGI
jgi:hypothetical protein